MYVYLAWHSRDQTKHWGSGHLSSSKDGGCTAALCSPCSVFYQAHGNIFPVAGFVRLAWSLFSHLWRGNNIIINFLKAPKDLLSRSMVIVIHVYLRGSDWSLRTESILDASMQELTAFSTSRRGINHIPRSDSQISAECSCCLQRWDVTGVKSLLSKLTWSQKW